MVWTWRVPGAPLRLVPLLVASIEVLGCSEGTGARSEPRPIPAVSSPTDVCGSELEPVVAPIAALGARLCGDRTVRARYLRADANGHDVVLVRVTDWSATETDGPVIERRHLVVDGADTGCARMPCAPLDALGSRDDAPAAQVTALLAIAISFRAGDVLLDAEAVEAQAARWPRHAEELRARSVGLERRPEAASLHAWVAHTVSGMAGEHRTLDYVSATLEGGTIRIDEERVVAESGAHLKSTAGAR